MKRLNIILLLLLATLGIQAQTANDANTAQETKDNLIKAALKGWHVRVGAGLALGGTSPIPLPAEIRSIESYNPTLCFYLEGDVEKRFDNSHWGTMIGVRFENRGMKTDASVKNYHMEAVNTDGSGTVVGAYTGRVKTEVDNRYLTFPVLVTYTFNDRWMVKAGPYLSWMMNGSFTGEAYDPHGPKCEEGDSYIRDQDPTGNKTDVTSATYDFSKDLRRFHWGVQVGGEFKAYKHLSIAANLQWGLNGIFPRDFHAVTFALYPIYGSLGFNYLF